MKMERRAWVTLTLFLFLSTSIVLADGLPTITSQPVPQAVLEGQTATFSVAATGEQPLSYQWRLNGFNLTDGGNISGSQTTNLIVSDVSYANTGDYSVMVTNLAGATTSGNAALTIMSSAPVIVMQPPNQTTTVGQTVVFNVGVVGNTPYSYQWSFDGTVIDSATNSSLTLTDVQLAQSGSYSVTVANFVGSTASSNAELTVSRPSPFLFFDDFSGPNLNPIWQTNLPSAWNGEVPAFPEPTPYIGAPTFSFGLLNSNTVLSLDSVIGPEQRVGWSSSTVFQADSFRYEARFNTEFFSPTTSVDGILEIWIMNATNNNLYDLVSPFAQGGNFLFMFFSSGVDANYFNRDAYAFAENTWYRLALQGLPGQNIRASLCDDNDNELMGFTFNHDASAFGSGFKIVISQSVGEDVMQPFSTASAVDYISLTSQFSPVIIDQPQSQTVLPGTNTAFSVIAEGPPPLSYQWTFDGEDIAGATNATFTLTDVQAADQGSYSVLVTNFYGSVLSSNAMLTFPPASTNHPSLKIAPQFGILFISWTTNSAGFVLVTSTNLESGNWVPVSPAPVQEGDEYFEVVSPNGNEAFYRLQFTGN